MVTDVGSQRVWDLVRLALGLWIIVALTYAAGVTLTLALGWSTCERPMGSSDYGELETSVLPPGPQCSSRDPNVQASEVFHQPGPATAAVQVFLVAVPALAWVVASRSVGATRERRRQEVLGAAVLVSGLTALGGVGALLLDPNRIAFGYGWLTLWVVVFLAGGSALLVSIRRHEPVGEPA